MSTFGNFMIDDAVKKDQELIALRERIRTLESACKAALVRLQMKRDLTERLYAAGDTLAVMPEVELKLIEQLEGAIKHG